MSYRRVSRGVHLADSDELETVSLMGAGLNTDEEERPGSGLSQDSGNCDHGSCSGAEDEGGCMSCDTADGRAIQKIRACAAQLWGMSEKLPKKESVGYDVVNNNNNQEDGDEKLKATVEGNGGKADGTLSKVTEKFESLLRDLSSVSEGANDEKSMPEESNTSPGDPINILRQTFTVSPATLSTQRKLTTTQTVVKAMWSNFPPTKAKKAPRNILRPNVQYVHV